MTLQQIADRLARVALSHCAHDSDPDIDEWAKYDLAVLTGKFRAELRPYLPKLKKEKISRFTRTCSLPGCDKLILAKNRSGVCTHCWNNRPDETSEVWAAIASVKGINAARIDRNTDTIGIQQDGMRAE